jgi:putative transposase
MPLSSLEQGSDFEAMEPLHDRVQFSNQMWLLHSVNLSIDVMDCLGTVVQSPWLVSFHDIWSQNIMGASLSSLILLKESLALTLRSSILYKQRSNESTSIPLRSGSSCPQNLLFYDKKAFSQISDLCSLIGIPCYLAKSFLQFQKVTERFETELMEYLSHLPDYRKGDQFRHVAYVPLQELEQLILQFIDERNQLPSSDKRHTRSQKWRLGLVNGLPEVPERALDICLPKSNRRLVYSKGRVCFTGWIYRDEVLTAHVGEHVFLRYNPRNITSILAYQKAGSEEVFLARPLIQNFHEENLSLADAKVILRQKRCRSSRD